jgi:hypothetical protein
MPPGRSITHDDGRAQALLALAGARSLGYTPRPRSSCAAVVLTLRSSSDTGILLRGRLEYGEAAVHRTERMLAFARLDQPKNPRLPARDRVVEKRELWARMQRP